MGPHDEKLLRFYDGELAPADADTVRAGLTDADREKLLALGEIGDLVKHALLTDAGEVDLWTGLAARLPVQAPAGAETVAAGADQVPGIAGAHPKGSVVSLDAAAHRGWSMSPARRRFMARTTAVVSALAMAAAFALWLVPSRQQTNHCDLESLSVAGGSASVLKVPLDHGDATTVLWVDHDEGDEWETL